jgi:hypothetical protein
MKMEQKAPMRPVISKRLELGGKSYWLPIPARYRELTECVRVLGVKSVEDEDDMQTVEYRSLIGVVPELSEHWRTVDDTSEALSRLTPGQLDVITRMCAEFELPFDYIWDFFAFIADAKKMTLHEIRYYGVPTKTENGDDC